MLEKITKLRDESKNPKVQSICENAISQLSNVMYNNVTGDAKHEIERVTMDNLFNELSIIEEDGVQSWIANGKRIFTLNNLGVRESISKLSETVAKEVPGLSDQLNLFKNRLDEEHEAVLYEEYISALQSMSFYPEIGSAIDAITGRVASYKGDVDLTKIMETMKKTRSSYLIPYIERYVENYLNEKSEQNKSFLKEALIKFSYDPFVRDIISVVTIDATNLQLEFANSECDIDKVYSPIIFLGENEAVFNVQGIYYIKKGNHINRLPAKEIPNLDEEFVAVCETFNRNDVEIVGNLVKVYIGEDYAEISDKGAIVNEGELTKEELARLTAASEWAGNSEFLNVVKTIQENYDELAEIDFAKRVYLKENATFFADVFKLRDNVFISTNNPGEGKATFYRNVNPIQAKNIMMEHLNFDVSRLFESLLPQEEKIQGEISETKQNYISYISKLEGQIEAFKNQGMNETTKAVIGSLAEELKEMKDEYTDYLNMVERYMLAPDAEVSDLSEDIKITIDTGKAKYMVPIPTDGVGVEGDVEMADPDEQQAGTVPGDDEIENEPASAVTFDDEETELLGDSPSIQDDEVDLGAADAEEEAEDAEAEAEEEADAEEDDFEEEGEMDLDLDDEGEEDEDQDEEIEKKEKKKKKKEKNESLERDSFVEESSEDKKPMKKVFLKKKKK